MRLIIDLTAKEYMTEKEVGSHGIDYVKIKASFGDKVPRPQAVDQFIETVKQFVATHDDDKEIAVVCTHGTNRSGYLICRYIMDIMDQIEPEEAINAFETARGESFPAEKPNLKNHLLSREWI